MQEGNLVFIVDTLWDSDRIYIGQVLPLIEVREHYVTYQCLVEGNFSTFWADAVPLTSLLQELV